MKYFALFFVVGLVGCATPAQKPRVPTSAYNPKGPSVIGRCLVDSVGARPTAKIEFPKVEGKDTPEVLTSESVVELANDQSIKIYWNDGRLKLSLIANQNELARAEGYFPVVKTQAGSFDDSKLSDYDLELKQNDLLGASVTVICKSAALIGQSHGCTAKSSCVEL